MIRIALTILLPLLLPTLVYVIWLATLARGQPAGLPLPRQGPPWIWLAAGGVVLAAIALAVLNVGVGGSPEGTYVPPHAVDGHVIPGHVIPRPAGPAQTGERRADGR